MEQTQNTEQTREPFLVLPSGKVADSPAVAIEKFRKVYSRLDSRSISYPRFLAITHMVVSAVDKILFSKDSKYINEKLMIAIVNEVLNEPPEKKPK